MCAILTTRDDGDVTVIDRVLVDGKRTLR